MLGASRWSLATASDALVARAQASGVDAFDQLSGELFGVSRVLDENLALRRILSDGGTADERRADLVTSIFGGKVRSDTLEVFADLVARRWAEPRDLVDAAELLGAQAAFLAAEAAGTLDTVEDELYRVARIAAANPELRTVLTDRWLPAERKVALLRDVFAAKVDPVTLAVVEQAVSSLRGRRLESALEGLAALASERHGQVLVEAHVARPMEPLQIERLAAALGRVYGRPARVTEVVDPEVAGGVRIVVGDEVIDGSVARRLEQARQQLAG